MDDEGPLGGDVVISLTLDEVIEIAQAMSVLSNVLKKMGEDLHASPFNDETGDLS